MIQCGQTWVFQHLEIEKYQVLTGNLATNSGTNKRTYSFTFENDYNSPFIFSELIIVKHVPRFIFTPSVTMKQFTPRNVARKKYVSTTGKRTDTSILILSIDAPTYQESTDYF